MVLIVAAGLGAAPAAARPLTPATLVEPHPCLGMVFPDILVYDDSYVPATLNTASPGGLGGTINWEWNSGTDNPVTASVTYRGKLALFDSGVQTSTTTAAKFSHTFVAAGTYPYYSTADTSERGSIQVPMCHVPHRARVNHYIWTQTSTKHLRTTAVDVEFKRPGAKRWAWLRSRVKDFGFWWKPTVNGTYQLRARLRRLSNNTTSGFSPVQSVKVS